MFHKILTSHLVSKSGGLFYHYLATKYKNKLWKDYKKTLNHFLQKVEFPSNKLFLIGPSAGYSLNSNWLSQFDKILVAEPDAIARKLLKLKFKNIQFVDSPLKLKLDLKDFTNTALNNPTFIFCNILGQLSSIYNNFDKNHSDFIAWKTQLHNILSEIKFVSYHEVYSFNTKVNIDSTSFLTCKSPQDCVGRVKQLVRGEKIVTFTDHQTQDLIVEIKNSNYFLWQIRPHHYHIIEFVHNLY